MTEEDRKFVQLDAKYMKKTLFNELDIKEASNTDQVADIVGILEETKSQEVNAMDS